jgi:hypothetical protein
MNQIEHIIEPRRLWLVWQPGELIQPRRRHIVAEIVRSEENIFFRYLVNTEDFKEAQKDGFLGYPAFKLSEPVHTTSVLDAFLRRIPPRKRDDFDEYLERYRLPRSFAGSDMALLGYTGAKLPGDGFELCADLEDAVPPFELVFEVAGFRHRSECPVSTLVIGEPVEFRLDPSNRHDSRAVSICKNGKLLGFVSRQHLNEFHRWKARGYSVAGVIERINGTTERPLVYIFVEVR